MSKIDTYKYSLLGFVECPFKDFLFFEYSIYLRPYLNDYDGNFELPMIYSGRSFVSLKILPM